MKESFGLRDRRLATPDQWAASFAQPLAASSETCGWRSGLIRRWVGGSGEIEQPPIDHHYVVLHLGGAKRVTRSGGGRTVAKPVEQGAVTLVPAGTTYDWMTEGPIDFVHLYVHPARLAGLIASRYDRDPSGVTLDEDIGVLDPLLEQLMGEMLAETSRAETTHSDIGAHSYLDALLDAALAQLARRHSTLGSAVQPVRSAMTRQRLRRVVDYIDVHLADPVRLDDLADAVGLSRFHFSRSFQAAMGEAPMAYLTRRRVDAAKQLLNTTDLPMTVVAQKSGLGAPSQFAALFKRATGVTPSTYRRHC